MRASYVLASSNGIICRNAYFCTVVLVVIFFFLRRIIIVYIHLLLNMTVSSYSVIFIFARCSAKNISSCYFFQNVIRANNYIYAKEKRNFLKKVKNSHVVCCTSILRCKPRAILQRKLKYWRLKSTDKTRNGKILRS